MKKQRTTDGNVIRSGTRMRESIRCLPKGHFQQIRQMFDKQSSSKSQTIKHEDKQQMFTSKLLSIRNEKLQKATTNLDDILIIEQSLTNCQTKIPNHSLSILEENDDQSMNSSLYRRDENDFYEDTHSYTKSSSQRIDLPIQRENTLLTSTQRRQLAMAAAVNYTDSYESSPTSNHLSRTGSTRHFVSSLQRTSTVQAKPVLVQTTCNSSKIEIPITYDTLNEGRLKSSRRLHSSTSLSSTGYDSNSSPSVVSKRNSVITNHSNDFSSSSDERLRCKPNWMLYESEINNPVAITNSYSSDDVFDSPSFLSTSNIKLAQSPISTLERRPVSVVRQTPFQSSSIIGSPSISSTSSPSLNPKYFVQTTSFTDTCNEEGKSSLDIPIGLSSSRRKGPLGSTSSTGFTVRQRSTNYSPILIQKHTDEREESPLPIVENPLFQQLAPRKPPRTFEHEHRYDCLNKKIDQKVPSSSSSTSDSPTFDLGARSVSCMDLTTGVSSVLFSTGLSSSENETCITDSKLNYTKYIQPNENIYEELKTPSSTYNKNDFQQFVFTNGTKSQTMRSQLNEKNVRSSMNNLNEKSAMKKVTSEPNLAKTKFSSSTFFSPRSLINRFKRILPLSLSKQSLNDHNSNTTVIDSDDSTSISSEYNDDIRLSRLDHVNRVKNVYDTLSTVNHMSNLFTDINHLKKENELKTLYDYVVLLLPEQEIGYFAHGNGCISSANLEYKSRRKTSPTVPFKYPPNVDDETIIKYFCFPDQHDSNNNFNFNSLLITKPEYFRFTLTNMHGTRQHGYCSRFVHKGNLNALCIISSCDMLDIYEKILSTATELFLSYKDEDAKSFLKEIYPHRLPNRGDTIHIHTATVGLYTLKCEYDRRKQFIDSMTLLNMSTETIIKIFSSILYEQKLIFISSELGSLTRLINTFVCLLYPFSWPHTFVPILPALMIDVIQAPTPYIIGILRSCEHYLSDSTDFLSHENSDVYIVDIDNDRISVLNEYLSIDNSSNNFNNTNNQILPKMFKIELKQEISYLRKNKLNLSIDECQQRLCNIFMSIFVQSCYDYKDNFNHKLFNIENFLQSKPRTIELFLEWFTRTQIFELFIKQKLDIDLKNQFAITFDLACEKYRRMLTNKQKSQPRITVKSVKRKAAIRANKTDNRL